MLWLQKGKYIAKPKEVGWGGQPAANGLQVVWAASVHGTGQGGRWGKGKGIGIRVAVGEGAGLTLWHAC